MDTYKRAGVVPVTLSANGEIDKSGEYSDWGGQPEKIDKNCFETAMRELNEESFGCITTTIEVIDKCIKIEYDGTIIFILPMLLEEFLDKTIEFSRECSFQSRRNANQEMIGVKMLLWDDVLRGISGGKFYSIVAEVINHNIENLMNLKQF